MKPFFPIAIILGIALTTPAATGLTPPPNIVYFYVDDMGWGSIGPNGQAERRAKGLPSVRTPNLDQLAARGINFTRGYGCHVCSPARSSQQSGFHQGHTFADRNDPDNAKKAMRSDDILMGDALSAAGYTTGYWGKWGYGGSKDMDRPTIDNVQTLPTSHGYQSVLAELHHVRAHTFFQPTLWSAPAKAGAKGGLELVPNSMARFVGQARYPESPSFHSDPAYPTPAYCDDLYAFAALDFVRANARAFNEEGKPFFALFAAQIPHAPFDEVSKLPRWDEAYKDDPHFAKLPKQAQQWAAMVTRIDAHFGNILAALDDPDGDGDPSDSIAANTLVIFQSDNGGPGGANNGVFDANGGLRGNKGSIHEGGIRVPLIMRWPLRIHADSKLKAGTSTDRVVDVTDLLPTFCELAGATPPLGIDGVSIAPLLTGEGHQREREFIIHEAGNGQSIIRGKHKLVRFAGGGKKKKNKDVGAGAAKTRLALFDLVEDHSEQDDIAATNPELVAELEELLLGERVAEPRGFANTYHHWTGEHRALTSDANNWSDYQYSNAGITYLSDDGPPRLSWTAVIENHGGSSKAAEADADLEFLGLEIKGKSGLERQGLTLRKGVNLTARNEIRLSGYGRIDIYDGTVTTLRWIDIAPEAQLGGRGKVVGEVFNRGSLGLAHGGPLVLEGDYRESPGAGISLDLADASKPQLKISGTAELAGKLWLSIRADADIAVGKPFTVIEAKSISGRFANSTKLLNSRGQLFKIGYTETTVTLTRTK